MRYKKIHFSESPYVDTKMARDAGLVWSPKDHAPEKKPDCKEQLQTVLQKTFREVMSTVLDAARRERAEKERILRRCQQLESWLLTASISRIDGNFILAGESE
jgi:hypothetical protein